jgi:hypothetical protein
MVQRRKISVNTFKKMMMRTAKSVIGTGGERCAIFVRKNKTECNEGDVEAEGSTILKCILTG